MFLKIVIFVFRMIAVYDLKSKKSVYAVLISNNIFSRISSMVEKLCILYGNKIADVNGTVYYDFPTLAALIDPSVEKSLRDAGFGYRAKFIYQSACKIMQMGGSDWLEFLQSLSYEQAKVELMKLPGIGAKVCYYI
jgi:N-glycosylase/DNA lyase